MKIIEIVNRIKDTCPSFEGRVLGAAEFDAPSERVFTKGSPVCFVTRDADELGTANMAGGYTQDVTDVFDLFVVVDTQKTLADALRMIPVDIAHDIRAELIRSLAGWDNECGVMYYKSGMNVVEDNKAHVVIGFTFALGNSTITQEMTAQNVDDFPSWDGGSFDVDVVSPAADPNTPLADYPNDPDAYVGSTGGIDGRKEMRLIYERDN